MLNHQPNRIEWRADTPFSTKFDDPYYSLDDGLAETEHVFLAGNDLPDRYCDGFHIAELGVWHGFEPFGLLGRLAPIRAKWRFTLHKL
jgi:tRNA U34 5-methylaminomethyl-2-thiouridine-forming methyltransferase MnmC